MSKRITLIPGDGIGPEVTAAAVQLLEAAGADLEWEEVEAGLDVVSKYGKPLPDQVLESIRKNKVALKGPLTTAVATGFPSANVELRQRLELYGSLRPVTNVPGIESRFGKVDVIIVRENTEGLYSGLEHTITAGVTPSLKIITREASARIAHFAFDYAHKWNRKKVTAAHKANILKISDGLFLKTCQEVARDYPDIFTKKSSWTTWPCSSSSILNNSISYLQPISMATSFPICVRDWWADWDSSPVPISERNTRSSKPFTGVLRTLPAKTKPIHWLSSSAVFSCSSI